MLTAQKITELQTMSTDPVVFCDRKMQIEANEGMEAILKHKISSSMGI